MSWHGVLGHDEVFERFRRALERGRLASTFLFVGPPGVGKRLTALRLAQALYCETYPETKLQACGHCPSCLQVLAGSYPDLELVSKPDDKSSIPVSTFIGEKEHRLREGLCHTISFKPSLGRRRMAIIDDADYLNEEGANCLLKTLEEPPPRSLLILIGTSEQKQLPTIRSRCQIVRFAPLEPDVIARLLLQVDPTKTESDAQRLALLAGGSLQRALELTDTELVEFREQFLPALERGEFESVDLARTTNSFIEELGKDAPLRRRRTRLIVQMAIEFYTQLMRSLAGHEPVGDEQLVQVVRQARRHWPSRIEEATACLERCLETLIQIDHNAHIPTVVDCWLDELTELAAGRLPKSAATW